MPTYEYECKSCSHNFEVFQQMSELPLKVCPKCGNEIRRLIFGGAGVIFKGSGFYTTDNGKSNGKPPINKDTTNKDSSQKSASETSGSPSSGEAAKNDACKNCPASGASSSSLERKCHAVKSSESKSA